MTNIAFGSAKRPYVPAAAKKKAPAAPRLPVELALAPASAALRSVAWEGEVVAPSAAEVASKAPSRSFPEGLDPLLSARAAFAQIPWNGEKSSTEQTGEQSKRSVKAVFDAFKWE